MKNRSMLWQLSGNRVDAVRSGRAPRAPEGGPSDGKVEDTLYRRQNPDLSAAQLLVTHNTSVMKNPAQVRTLSLWLVADTAQVCHGLFVYPRAFRSLSIIPVRI